MSARVVVVGGGVFGLTAAIELRTRGWDVALLDAGPVPHPRAASTDVSKVVRMEYGADEAYMALMEQALLGWRRWNDEWRSDGLEPLFHETGVMMVSREPMRPRGFEHDSRATLRRRGHEPERLDAEAIARRYPAWRPGAFVDGFYHARGGYAESGAVVAWLAESARTIGVRVRPGEGVAALLERDGHVRGVRTHAGREVEADRVVVAAGAWASQLLPGLADNIRATGHAVFHLRPADPEPFRASGFPVFTADIARTGYYGFPIHPGGFVKIANHGPGGPVDLDGPAAVTEEDEARLRTSLADTFPALVAAPIVYSRVCPYADTHDGDFWIAPDPERPGLTVAGGGSGHGFKFAPVLGELIANAVEGQRDARLGRFRWRPEVRRGRGEAARYRAE
jgi:glycine/D-amino acid oxidase-like deaminating enzyme